MQSFKIDNIVKEGKVIRKLGNNITLAFLISKDGYNYFLKYKPVFKRGKFAKFYNILGLTSLLFKKEIEAYENLSEIGFKYFKFPKLIDATKEYLLTEFVQGERVITLSSQKKQELIRSLAEFQILGGKSFKYSFSINAVFKITSWRLFTLMRRNLFRMFNVYGVKKTLKALFILQKIQFKNKKINQKLLIHGDLRKSHSDRPYSNIIHHESTGIHIIDFDSLKTYNKLILQDIINLSFRVDTQILDYALIKIYLLNLKDKICLSSLNIEEQIRYELILIICNQSRIQKYIVDSKRFLDLLLDRKSFNNWLEEQKRNDL